MRISPPLRQKPLQIAIQLLKYRYVIPAPDPLREEVKVLLNLREGATHDFKDFIKNCSAGLSYFKVPCYVEIVEEFPKRPTQRNTEDETQGEERQKEDHGWDGDKEMLDWGRK